VNAKQANRLTRGYTTRGFTLIEAVIASVLGTIMFGSMVMAIQRGAGVFEQSVANNDVDSRAARALDRITREILGASSGSLNPTLETPVGAPTVWSSTLDYQEPASWAGAVVLGQTIRITLELEDGEIDNGLDDNNNGLIDERQIVRIVDPGPNEQRTVLLNGVSAFLEGELANGLDDNANGLIDEQGLSFDLTGSTLNVRLSLERIGPGQRLIVRTQIASIAFRN